MSCEDFFTALRAEGNFKAEIIDEKSPDCLCEMVSVSPYSSGPVQDNEMVWRLILSPIHYDLDTGKIKESAFSDASGRGMSVLRDIIGTQDLIIGRGEARAKLTNRKFECAAGAKVSALRSLRSSDGKGRFCVYDTAEADERVHADICQTRHPGKAEQKQLRRELQKIFNHIIYPSERITISSFLPI